MDDLLVYGSYGYTGRLVAREAVSRGGAPVLAGRNRDRVREQADDLGLEWRAFDLEAADEHVGEFDAVCNFAGPFVDTAASMVEACLEAGTDYLDVTGEVDVLAALARLDEAATEAGVTLLPGVGFDVTPSDCLAAWLHETFPSADALAVGITGWGSLTAGTLRTGLRNVGDGGVIRRNGKLLRVPTAAETRAFDFGSGPTATVAVPLGDVVTAYHSTGIGTIATYIDLPRPLIRAMAVGRPLEPVLATRPIRRALERLVDAVAEGPDERERETGQPTIQAEVRVDDRIERARVRTPNTYALTADAVVSAATRVLSGEAPAGFQTPATAFGHDFVTSLEGVERERLPPVPGSDGA